MLSIVSSFNPRSHTFMLGPRFPGRQRILVHSKGHWFKVRSLELGDTCEEHGDHAKHLSYQTDDSPIPYSAFTTLSPPSTQLHLNLLLPHSLNVQQLQRLLPRQLICTICTYGVHFVCLLLSWLALYVSSTSFCFYVASLDPYPSMGLNKSLA